MIFLSHTATGSRKEKHETAKMVMSQLKAIYTMIGKFFTCSVKALAV